jgi:hypothetical protein
MNEGNEWNENELDEIEWNWMKLDGIDFIFFCCWCQSK